MALQIYNTNEMRMVILRAEIHLKERGAMTETLEMSLWKEIAFAKSDLWKRNWFQLTLSLLLERIEDTVLSCYPIKRSLN